jgi:hypothetical protein
MTLCFPIWDKPDRLPRRRHTDLTARYHGFTHVTPPGRHLRRWQPSSMADGYFTRRAVRPLARATNPTPDLTQRNQIIITRQDGSGG